MDPFKSSSSSIQGGGLAVPKFETEIKPIDQPIGKKPRNKNPAATFLGSDAMPGPASANLGGKTLMGA